MSADELPLVVRVVEGDAPLDVEGRTIGWESLREGDYVHHRGDPPNLWLTYSTTRNSDKYDMAQVQPRPVSPELAVGVGVRYIARDSSRRYGYVLAINMRPDGVRVVDVLDADDTDGPIRRTCFASEVETISPDGMPKYQPPPGITSDLPPELATEFRINGTRWVFRSGRWFIYPPTYGDANYGYVNHPEQAAWLARALTAGRGDS